MNFNMEEDDETTRSVMIQMPWSTVPPCSQQASEGHGMLRNLEVSSCAAPNQDEKVTPELQLHPDASRSLTVSLDLEDEQIQPRRKRVCRQQLFLTKSPEHRTETLISLMTACRDGLLEVVTLILESGFDVDVVYSGWTPLIQASHAGHPHIVKRLIQMKADLDKTTPANDWTPLIAAAEAGHAVVAQVLVEAKADLYYQSKTGDKIHALIAATMKKHPDVLEVLLNAGTENVNVPAVRNNWTPLMCAAFKGGPWLIELLARKASQIRYGALTNESETALQLACRHGFGNPNYLKAACILLIAQLHAGEAIAMPEKGYATFNQALYLYPRVLDALEQEYKCFLQELEKTLLFPQELDTLILEYAVSGWCDMTDVQLQILVDQQIFRFDPEA